MCLSDFDANAETPAQARRRARPQWGSRRPDQMETPPEAIARAGFIGRQPPGLGGKGTVPQFTGVMAVAGE